MKKTIVKFSPNQDLPPGYIVIFLDGHYQWEDTINDIESVIFWDRFRARRSAWHHYNTTPSKSGFFPYEKQIIGNNIHSVYTKCKSCLHLGINMPGEANCGNCGSDNTYRYYDSETIQVLLLASK